MFFETADARSIQVYKKVSLEFKFDNIPDINYKIMPYILESTGTGIILGTSFLLSNNVLIDYKNKAMVIDNYYINMPFEDILEELDQKLIDKTKLYSLHNEEIDCYFHINSNIPSNLRDLLKEHMATNKQLGCITNHEYEIEVEGTHTHFAKPYRVPILLKDALESELEKLQELKIIKKSNSNFITPLSQY